MFLFLVIQYLIFIQIKQILKIVVSDTSTLILFQKIKYLDLLQKIYGELTLRLNNESTSH